VRLGWKGGGGGGREGGGGGEGGAMGGRGVGREGGGGIGVASEGHALDRAGFTMMRVGDDLRHRGAGARLQGVEEYGCGIGAGPCGGRRRSDEVAAARSSVAWGEVEGGRQA